MPKLPQAKKSLDKASIYPSDPTAKPKNAKRPKHLNDDSRVVYSEESNRDDG